MDDRSLLPFNPIAPLPVSDSKKRPSLYTSADLDRARSIAESFSRTVYTVEETLQVADQMFSAGLYSCSRGQTDHGIVQLTRSLIGTALAVWQYDQLAASSLAERDFGVARSLSNSAAQHIGYMPGRLQLAASALRSGANSNGALAEMKATVIAFVAGCGLATRVLNETAAISWQRALSVATEQGWSEQSNRVTAFGVPQLSLHTRTDDPNRLQTRNGCPGLSTREREVLTQIVAGLTTSEIAYRLGVKTTTVATLVGRIFNKLGVNNRPSAVAAALRYGLCTQDE